MELLLLFAGVMSIGMFGSASTDVEEAEAVNEAEVAENPIEPTPSVEISPGDEIGDATDTEEAERIEGTNGNDTINGLNGDDTIFGGEGDDSLIGGAGSDFIDAGAGDDTVYEGGYLREDYPDGYFDGDDTILGGEGNDVLDAHDGDDSLDGGTGNDALYGRDGDDTLIGGTGDDSLHGMEGNDSIEGDAGNDTLSGGAGTDTIYGGDGNDRINNGYDRDDDILSEFIDAGAGDDIVRFGDGSTVTGGTGADSFTAYESMSNTLVSEITDFDPSEDTLFIDLGVGNGDGGEFSLVEREDGQGRDLFLGDEMVIRLSGDAPFTLDDITLTVRFEYTDGTPIEYTIGNNETGLGTKVIGSYGDDIITGSNTGDVIATFGGSDVVDGGEGDDTIFGDGGSVDTFIESGESYTIVDFERDTIDGGNGDDIIYSINGNDITGGEGEDLFVLQNDRNVFGEYDDVIFGDHEGLDPTIITDFTAGEDVILVRGIPGTLLDAGDLSITVLEDGTGAELTVEDQVVAIIIGGQDLTIGDIEIQELPDNQYVAYGPYNLIPGYF